MFKISINLSLRNISGDKGLDGLTGLPGSIGPAGVCNKLSYTLKNKEGMIY